ncbi:hypothetical protein FOTG_13850 [Fusarium oxysporum f. sp. vasinfectum 25433]|uniref:Zinc knuckle domain-containing protein n=2 Tax=Fusarium TaxID=5506 RepID=X0KWP2_FUSOX|nr:hypothetical protein FOTG_13850 [Fusarium oxysporum f. sp. vasinfectum 25433]
MPAFAKGKDHTEGMEEWKEFYRLWQEIAYSKTEETYNERLLEFKEHYETNHLIERVGSPQLIIQPRRQFDRLVILPSAPPTSTQREPSLFEHVEKQVQQRKPPKCSACGNEGHTRVSKACPLRYNELRLPPTNAPALAPTFKPPPRAPSLGPPVPFPTVTATMTTTTTTQTAIYIATTPFTFSSPPSQAREPSPPQYDTPEAIYNRYKASREAWRATLPPRAKKDDKAYRKAKGLPAKYSKSSVKYALDWKRMNRQCDLGIGKGKRDWTQEEIYAYLDFEEAEEEHAALEEQIRLEKGPYQGQNGIQDCINAAALCK